jgi:lycopene beta-cyclase
MNKLMDEQSGQYDVVFVGGGLSSALSLLALLAKRPRAAVALVERDARLGGNHTWCFHQRDVPEGARGWLEPLLVHRWSGYSGRFPGHERRVGSAYACVSSARLHELVSARCRTSDSAALLLGASARAVGADRVTLEDGRTLRAKLVVDARGPHLAQPASGYQKFVGLELAVAPGHALREPILIDATLPQRDGLRFMYTRSR